jgi:nitrogen fixation protein NifU and related proteins
MTLDMYQENILDHYTHPHNKRKLEHFDMRAQERNPLCGDEIEVFVALDGERRISEVTFEGQGCAISQAAISMMTDEVRGKSLDELERMTTEDVRELVGVPLSPVRLKCAVLSLQSLHKALADYKMRQMGLASAPAAAATAEGHVHGPHCVH